jgi:hypothetical protein
MDFGQVTLDITSARESDAGIFTCVAQNASGVASTSGTLKVRPGVDVIKLFFSSSLDAQAKS